MRSKRYTAAELRALSSQDAGLVAGVDEAGRGPLAGPVVAAAVILHPLKAIPGLADSKVLSAKKREILFEKILANALCCSVAQASVEEIDRLNILQATMLAMERAVKCLRLAPVRVLIDGNRSPKLSCQSQTIVGGDARVACISAASIMAKVTRDRWCEEIDKRWPEYGFAKHKGYGTALHMAALKRLGPLEIHRQSFAPVAALLQQKPTL